MEEAWELAALDMPTILRYKGYKFFFYSAEEDRPHVHVTKQNSQAKIWLETQDVAKSVGFISPEIKEICKLVSEHKENFQKKWDEHFSLGGNDDE